MYWPFVVLTVISAILVAPSVATGSHCTFVCPDKDLAGHALVEHSQSSSQLFCRYKNIPNDFFCKYYRDNGDQKQDHDRGKCPSVAKKSCSGSSPSSVPVCGFNCPSKDKAGRSLVEHSQSSSELFCRYETIPNDFFCKYFRDTGLLKQDHDQSKCPSTAKQCCGSKRAAIPRSPAPPSPAARSNKPHAMERRAALVKKRRANDS